MKKSLRSTNSEELRSNMSRSHLQSSKSSHIHVAPSTIASTSAPNSSNVNGTKKHGLGFGRFSLRRIFNPSSIGRTLTSKHRTTFRETLSDNSSAYDSKSISNAKLNAYRPTHSSLDTESYSSGRSDYYHPNTSIFMEASSGSSGVMECPLCLLEQPASHFPELSSCPHRACHHCLQQYLKIEILESRVNIHCPECSEPLHPNDIQKILNYDPNLIEKYESFMIRRILVTEPDARWCPAPDCGYVVIASGCASCPKLRCQRPGCETSFCYHCKQEWHPNQTCDAARAQRGTHRSPNSKSSPVSFSHDSIIQRDDIKPCPCCKVPIIKMDDGSCNHMTCSVCGTEFCWLCMKEISDLHYLSPSGCTFWGKKPWSRKKKIMWQLGMLVGAPVGIALIAGIAVPAIIIGIPVWVGRKLHARFERHQMSRHKRNLLVTTGVLTSIFVSPILAAVAVGIGVPILLAYVYGVVPISLCRSGGCGVTTSPSGVRIELDEENEIGIGPTVAADGVSVDTALSNRVNPSIGELSFGMSASVSMGSGSHLDRLAAADRETASLAACAGSIASGNISTNKVEFQADVSSNKRFSLSSETASATLSLGDRSGNVSLMDDASVKALAGSISGYKMDNTNANAYGNGNAITPVEVHVDAAIINGSHPTEEPSSTSCCCENASDYERTNRTNDALHYAASNDYNDCVAYIDDAPNSCESVPIDTKRNKCDSFQKGTKISPNLMPRYESRSLEHIANYCEICHKTHRPCCPNYVHQTNTSGKNLLLTNSQNRKQKSKSVLPHEDEQRSSKHRYHPPIFAKRRTSSVKSNNSNFVKNEYETEPYKELKRVRSSEYHDENKVKSKHRKGSLTSVFRSTPASPTNADTSFEQFTVNEKRAFQISSNKYHMKKQMPPIIDAKQHVIVNINDHHYPISLKSSEV